MTLRAAAAEKIAERKVGGRGDGVGVPLCGRLFGGGSLAEFFIISGTFIQSKVSVMQRER